MAGLCTKLNFIVDETTNFIQRIEHILKTNVKFHAVDYIVSGIKYLRKSDNLAARTTENKNSTSKEKFNQKQWTFNRNFGGGGVNIVLPLAWHMYAVENLLNVVNRKKNSSSNNKI